MQIYFTKTEKQMLLKKKKNINNDVNNPTLSP